MSRAGHADDTPSLPGAVDNAGAVSNGQRPMWPRAELIDTRPVAEHDGELADRQILHNLLARGFALIGGETADRRVAGVRVRCRAEREGPHAGLSLCLSIEPGVSEGMMVSMSAADRDELPRFALHFDRLDPDARLDGRLFEIARRWDSPR